MPGDVNMDCVFDVLDVEFMQEYVVGLVLEEDLSEAQIASMDSNNDGHKDGLDIGYLMNCVAKKCEKTRFILRLLLHSRSCLPCILTLLLWHLL